MAVSRWEYPLYMEVSSWENHLYMEVLVGKSTINGDF